MAASRAFKNGREVLLDLRFYKKHLPARLPLVFQLNPEELQVFFRSLISLLKKRHKTHVIITDFDLVSMDAISKQHICNLLILFKEAKIQRVTFDFTPLSEREIVAFFASLKENIKPSADLPAFDCKMADDFDMRYWNYLLAELNPNISLYSAPIRGNTLTQSSFRSFSFFYADDGDSLDADDQHEYDPMIADLIQEMESSTSLRDEPPKAGKMR